MSFFSKKESSYFSPEKISGLIAPIPTPLNEDLSFDEISLKNLVGRLLNKGVMNFFVFGRFGEFELISSQKRQEILSCVRGEVFKKASLIVGCFGNNAEEIISRINEAHKHSDACVFNVPAGALENELAFADFFEELMRSTKSRLFIYNNPFLFKKNIPLAWLENFINWENILGVVTASRNPDYFEELSRICADTKIFEENEEFVFDALRSGFSGVACISSILYPSYYLDLVNNFDKIDYAKMMRNEAKVFALSKLFPSKRVQAVKHVLSLQGIIQPYHFPILAQLDEKDKLIIEKTLGVGSRFKEEKELLSKRGSVEKPLK